jgi:ParB-like chromosome segregation protein Spo0J
MTMEFHPIANAFPLIEGDQFNELAADIQANGLREPIVLFSGQVLDGRNRYRACIAAGIDPQFEEYSGADPIGLSFP